MQLDPILLPLVGTLLTALVMGVLLQRIRQPFAIGCLLAGVAVGPDGLALLSDAVAVGRVGSFGVVLLLFFVGMESASGPRVGSWKVPLIGTALQVLGSVLCVAAVGVFLDWPLTRILLLGFVISLSCTAVVLRLLAASGDLQSEVGRDVVSILIAQDIAVVPMLLVIGFLSGGRVGPAEIGLQVAGGIGILALVVWIMRSDEVNLPGIGEGSDQKEVRVIAALGLCLGLALLTGLVGLSTGLGAFVGGMLVAKARETHWVSESLRPFEVLFLGVFFVSVGMLLDLDFLREHLGLVLLLVALVLLTNTFLNAAIMRVLGDSWRDGLYAGALLAQAGEFSYVLAAVGLKSGLITSFGYQMTLSVITLSMAASGIWVAAARRLLRR